jgi:hypothetical protein
MHTFFSPDASFLIGQWLFIKFLAITYFIAFASILVQIKGLYGKDGILPMEEIFKGINRSKLYRHFYYTPSLFWFSRSDAMLQGLAILGMLCSVAVLFGFAVPLMLFFLFIFYLSYVSTGIYFLSFQWDILLLEVGFAGFIFSWQMPPLPIAVFLLWIILFRFMFSSGVVKFLTGSKEWRDLTALDYHYETQPLPNRMGYYFFQQPKWFSKASTIVVFIVELIVPFLIFTTDEIRLVVFITFVAFQLIIMLTGNYAFFNILTIALCFPLLDDKYLSWIQNYIHIQGEPLSLSTSILTSMTSMILIVLNFFQLTMIFKPLPFVERVLSFTRPLYLINHYGLFSWMTTKRYEIILEGSDDGDAWKEYEFKWKPGDLKTPPKQVAPHQPRLDWQMWFAALGHAKQNPWFTRLIYQILEGSNVVLKLFKTNPFPEKAPKFVRAHLYEYQFTTLKEKKETGDYWKRNYLGIYFPSIRKN